MRSEARLCNRSGKIIQEQEINITLYAINEYVVLSC
jgi:hypothetical protein